MSILDNEGHDPQGLGNATGDYDCDGSKILCPARENMLAEIERLRAGLRNRETPPETAAANDAGRTKIPADVLPTLTRSVVKRNRRQRKRTAPSGEGQGGQG